MDVQERAARGARRDLRRSYGARRWCVRRERRAVEILVGGCGAQKFGVSRSIQDPSRSRRVTRIAKAHCGLVAAPCVAIRSGVSKVMTRLAVGLACSQSQNPQKISKHSKMVCLGLVWSGIWLGVAGTAFWPPPRFPADAPSTAPGGQSPGAICSGVKYHGKNRTTGGVAVRAGLRRCVLGFFPKAFA